MGVHISQVQMYCVSVPDALPNLEYEASAVSGCASDSSCESVPYNSAWYIAACADGETDTCPVTNRLELMLPEAPALDQRVYGFGVYIATGSKPLATQLQVNVHSSDTTHTAWWDQYIHESCAEWTISTDADAGALQIACAGTAAATAHPNSVMYLSGVLTIQDTVDLQPGAYVEVQSTACILQALKLGVPGKHVAPGPAPPTAPQNATVQQTKCEIVVSWKPAVMPLMGQTAWVVQSITAGSTHLQTTVPVSAFQAVFPRCPKAPSAQFVVYGLTTPTSSTPRRQTPYSNPSWQCCCGRPRSTTTP
jgi:hypothetical protein